MRLTDGLDALILPEPIKIVDESALPPHISVALYELGVAEVKGQTANPRIVEYFSCLDPEWHFLSDEISWCSAFVNWCFYKTFGPMTRSPAALSWQTKGYEPEIPCLGDVAVFKNIKSNWQGHVGFFVAFNSDKSQILILGGNQKNQVCYQWIPIKGPRLHLHSIRRLI